MAKLGNIILFKCLAQNIYHPTSLSLLEGSFFVFVFILNTLGNEMLYKVSSNVISFCTFSPSSSATALLEVIRFCIFWPHLNL